MYARALGVQEVCRGTNQRLCLLPFLLPFFAFFLYFFSHFLLFYSPVFLFHLWSLMSTIVSVILPSSSDVQCGIAVCAGSVGYPCLMLPPMWDVFLATVSHISLCLVLHHCRSLLEGLQETQLWPFVDLQQWFNMLASLIMYIFKPDLPYVWQNTRGMQN